MNVSDVSLSTSLVAVATDAQASRLRSQIGFAVLGELQDQQKQMADALVRMMESAPGPDYLGKNVDVRV